MSLLDTLAKIGAALFAVYALLMIAVMVFYYLASRDHFRSCRGCDQLPSTSVVNPYFDEYYKLGFNSGPLYSLTAPDHSPLTE